MEMLLARGFVALNISDLAAELNCSKSTLYSIAPSKEQLLAVIVKAYFKRSTQLVEESVDTAADPVTQIGDYLMAVSTELAKASPQFFADLETFAPAGDIYRRNTQAAAARVTSLVRRARPDADAVFMGAVAALTMESVHRGDILRATGLDDAAAYRALAHLIVAGLSGDHKRSDTQTPNTQSPNTQRMAP